MLVTEPIVACIALYASFVYALLYLTLEVFPIVFQENRGYSILVGSLPFLGLFLGVLAAIGLNLANQPYLFRKLEASGGKAVPEARLPPMMVGSVCDHSPQERFLTHSRFSSQLVSSGLDGLLHPNIHGSCQRWQLGL